jgi:hypothetical protein
MGLAVLVLFLMCLLCLVAAELMPAYPINDTNHTWDVLPYLGAIACFVSAATLAIVVLAGA